MLEDFWEDYESSADSVNSANYALISNALQRWLYMLDSNALVVQHLEPLEKSMDFDKWYAECEATQGGMSGTARLTLPIETERRLGAMLFLMRKSAADQLGAVDIGHSFLGGDAHYDTNVREFQSQIFQPLR